MKTYLMAATALLALSGPALAQSWELNPAASRLAYGSVKSDYIGEVNHFTGLTGTVSEDGSAVVEVDLSSVQTNVDTRNERMVEYVFQNTANATISTDIDMDMVMALGVGESAVMESDATLALVGQEISLFTELFVTRLGEGSVMVTTNDMLFLAADEAGIDGAIDTLMELAGLDSITRAVPETLRYVFEETK